jgi:hypothetical protein
VEDFLGVRVFRDVKILEINSKQTIFVQMGTQELNLTQPTIPVEVDVA